MWFRLGKCHLRNMTGMYATHGLVSAHAGTANSSVFSMLLLSALLICGSGFAQVTSGSISGIVHDSSDAVLPGAKVVLTNQATGTSRQTTSNGTGNFTFSAVPSGVYTVTVSHAGFSDWQLVGLALDQGDNKTLTQVALRVGSEQATVTVSAMNENIPVDTGQTQLTLNAKLVSELSIQGRDAAELIKVMPGMAMSTGLGQTQYSSLTTGTTNGPVGAFSASGTPVDGGLNMTLDGANITDVGTNGLQLININQDQTEQVSVLTSAFGAEYAKGPVLFQALSKSGGNSFHGDLYLYARDGALNATDAYLKASGLQKPDDRYFYPGFTVGGPVWIPGTRFKMRNKLFFFGGYEYEKQQPAGSPHQLFVPTPELLAGDFSPQSLSTLHPTGPTATVPCATPNGTYCPTSGIVNGVIPKSQIDANALALAKLFPKPNQNPATHQGYNYIFLDNPPLNRWEARARLDYSPNVNNQISGSYTRQNEGFVDNFGVYWNPGDTVPFPSRLNATRTASFWSGNYTHTFGPRLTNNIVFTYINQNFPLKPSNQTAADPAAIGYSAPAPFKTNVIPQIPNLISWGCNQSANNGCFPGIYSPGFTQSFQNGAFGYTKHAPTLNDDITAVVGTHTLKVGGYWDLQQEIVASGYGTWGQGAYEFDYWGSNSTGNPLADFLLGHASNYTQVGSLPVQDIRFHQYSFYAQDQWKVGRKMTLNYGVRFDHEGQWYPDNHPGFAVWDPSLYSDSPGAPAFTGLTWHAKNHNVPVSGWSSALFNPLPRLGVAYDLLGNGSTVIRGGYGKYVYQVSYNDVQVAYNQPLGIQNVSTPALNSFADAANYSPTVVLGQNGNVAALRKGDDRTPYTESYNVTVSQRAFKNSTWEISYVGNRTHDQLLTDTSNSSVAALSNINKISLGGLFGPDPVTGTTFAPGAVPGTSLQDYRPYHNYMILNVVTHGSHSNYNALMTSWQKQRGNVTFSLNYTFSKAMGIRDGQTDNASYGSGATTDAFVLGNNYAPLAFDRSHIFNAAYVIQLPSPIRDNRLIGGVVNGWQVSGVTQWQSGPPLQPNTAGTLNATFPGSVTNQSILGTDSQVLRPTITCDIRGGKHFNPACFGVPSQGQNGPAVFPYIKGPAYFNSDLGVYKNFAMEGSRSIQFRLTAFNFLNHPLSEFGLGPDVNLALTGANGENTNAATNGSPLFTVGRRVLETAVKFVF